MSEVIFQTEDNKNNNTDITSLSLRNSKKLHEIIIESKDYNNTLKTDNENNNLTESTTDDTVANNQFSSKKTSTGMEFRVMIRNIPRYANVKQLKKHIISVGVENPGKIAKSPSWDYAFLTLKTQEEQSSALELLNKSKYKKNKIFACVSNVSHELREAKINSLIAKRQEEQKNDTRSPKEQLADKVTPLHAVPYNEQLEQKQESMKKILKKFREDMLDLPKIDETSWVVNKEENLPCELLNIVQSPKITGYRNKCEFTIGYNMSNEKTIGFLLGGFSQGILSVVEPNDCVHISSTAKRIAQVMQEYIRSSHYDVYNRKTKQGNWRLLTVRTQENGQSMVVVSFHTQSLPEEEITNQKQDLIKYFTGPVKEQGISIDSLYFHKNVATSDGLSFVEEIECIWGDQYIYEDMLDCRFRISPKSFFQVNTKAAELLYSKCQAWALEGTTDINEQSATSRKTTKLLDLCCGTGTIGITMARKFDQVVGVELVPEAIEDAKFNAELNKIQNVEYHAGKVEESLNVLNTQTHDSVVAVLDPP
ncbi:13270_t:CDS:10, partial [Ambispora leptoticha]